MTTQWDRIIGSLFLSAEYGHFVHAKQRDAMCTVRRRHGPVPARAPFTAGRRSGRAQVLRPRLSAPAPQPCPPAPCTLQ